MRKSIIVLAATVVALCACQKNEIELLDKPIIANDGNQVTYTFTAVIADDVTDIETKATMARTGAYTWAVNDDLKFYKEDGTSAPAKVTAVDGSTATITVTTTDDRSSFVSAIYPASAAAAKDKITFNARGPIVVSAVNGGTLKFYHIGSVINLKFTGIPVETQSLVFEPTSAFNYDGTFEFSERVPSLKAATGSTSKIVVPASKADEDKDISVSVPSVMLNGFSAALNNAADGAGRNLFKKSTAESHDLATKRPVLMNMKKVAYEAPGKYYVKTESKTGFWDRIGIRMIQTSANTYDLSLNCDGNSTYYIYDEYNTDSPITGHIAMGLAKEDFSTGTSTIELQGYFNSDNKWNTQTMSYEGDWCSVKNLTFSNINSSGETEICFKDGDTYWKGVDLWVGGAATCSTSNDWNVWVKGISEGTKYDVFFNSSSHEAILRASSNEYDPNEASGVWKLSFNSSSGLATHVWKKSIEDDPFGNASFPKTTFGFKSDFDGWASVHNSATTYNNLSWIIGGISISLDASKSFGLCDGGSNFWSDLSSDSSFATVNPGTNLYGTLTYWRDGGHTNPYISLESGDYIIFANENPDVNGGINIMFEKQ